MVNVIAAVSLISLTYLILMIKRQSEFGADSDSITITEKEWQDFQDWLHSEDPDLEDERFIRLFRNPVVDNYKKN